MDGESGEQVGGELEISPWCPSYASNDSYWWQWDSNPGSLGGSPGV